MEYQKIIFFLDNEQKQALIKFKYTPKNGLK